MDPSTDLDASTGEEAAASPGSQQRCRRCGNRMTWAAQRRQYGRLLGRGLSREEAKAVGRLCQKCMTAFLRSSPPSH